MNKFHALKIKELKKETSNSVSIVLDIPTELTADYKYIAGQHLTLKKEFAGTEIRRSYSICSAPISGELRIAIKAVENGTFSGFATTVLKEGDVLEVSKPDGKFTLKTAADNSLNYLGIAAGSGITPIMAMIKAVLTEEPKSTFTLIYGNKSRESTIFKNEIDKLQTDFSNRFNVQYVFSKEQNEDALFGRIDKGNINFAIKNKWKDVAFEIAFLCGPEAMINSSKETLIEYGFDKNKIHYELFTTPVSSESVAHKTFEGTCEITVLLDDEETTFSIESKNTILTSVLKKGLDAPYSCQGGICSSCLAKVTEGNASMDKNSILSDAEVEEGFILTCQAHPTTQKLTIDYDAI